MSGPAIRQIRMTSALRLTRSVVPLLTIGGQPPAAQIGGYLRSCPYSDGYLL